MIQRKQSVWLLLIALCAFATYRLPLYAGHLQDNSEKKYFITDSFLLFPLVFGIGALALISIFLFKKRKLQFRLSVIGVLVSILTIILEYFKTQDFKVVNNFQSGFYQFG